MSPRSRRLLIVSCLALLALAGVSFTDSRAPFEPAEVARVRHHLEGARELLARRDLSALSPAQRAARAQCARELEGYTDRGVFPHNHHVSGRSPVFVDEHGTRCAMAYLLERSGAGEIVRRIAATRNLARIRELAGDPEVVAWLDHNGLTLAEAARIQPEYGGPDVRLGSSPDGRTGEAVAGILAGGVGIVTNLHPADTPEGRNVRGVFGVACGLTSVVLGARVFQDENLQVAGLGTIALGVVSFGLGLHQVGSGGSTASAARVSLSPAVWSDREGGRQWGLVARF